MAAMPRRTKGAVREKTTPQVMSITTSQSSDGYRPRRSPSPWRWSPRIDSRMTSAMGARKPPTAADNHTMVRNQVMKDTGKKAMVHSRSIQRWRSRRRCRNLRCQGVPGSGSR